MTASAGSASDVRHLDQGKRPASAFVVLRSDMDCRAERGQDREQVGGKRRAAVGMVAGHEDVAGDAARAAHLIAGQEAGVPDQLPQPGRLFGGPPADHFGDVIHQALDRHRGPDVNSRFLLRDPSQLRDAGNVDEIRRLLLLVDTRGRVAEDELDLLLAGLTDELLLEPVDLRERGGAVPFPTAAREMEGSRRAGRGQLLQVDPGKLTSPRDRVGRIHQAFLGLVRGGIVVAGQGPNAMKDGSIARAATEVAAEDILDFLLRGRRLLLQEGVGRHDESRRAEPALRAVVHGDAVLNRVQSFVNVANAFGGRDHHAIERSRAAAGRR